MFSNGFGMRFLLHKGDHMEFITMLFRFAWLLFSMKWPGLPFTFGQAFLAVVLSSGTLTLLLKVFGVSLPEFIHLRIPEVITEIFVFLKIERVMKNDEGCYDSDLRYLCSHRWLHRLGLYCRCSDLWNMSLFLLSDPCPGN